MSRQDILLDPAAGLHTVDLSLDPSNSDERLRPDSAPREPASSPQPLMPGASATVNTQVWLERFPWRPTAAWSAITALVALNAFAAAELDWRDLVLLLLLVDPLWGSIWRLAAGRDGTLPIRTQIMRAQLGTQRVWLPYVRPGSPAIRLLGWEDETALPLLFRVVLPSVVLALAVGLVMGTVVLWLTVTIVVLSALGWISQRTWGQSPFFLQSLVTVALPWGLALNLFSATQSDVRWVAQIALLTLWTVHHWGECRSIHLPNDRAGMIGMGVADFGIALLLVMVQAPLWLALLSIVWLSTWFRVYHQQSLVPARFWWLGAMLLSGLALGWHT